MLHNPAVPAGGFHALAAFEDVVTDRLLDIHVLAGLTGPNRDQRMPVVAGGHTDHIEILVVQRHANVLNTLRLQLRAVQAQFAEPAKQAAVGINQVRDLHVGHGQEFVDVAAPAPVDAGHAHAHRVVRTQNLARGTRAGHREQGKHGAGRGGHSQKVSTCQSAHRQLLGQNRRVWGAGTRAPATRRGPDAWRQAAL